MNLTKKNESELNSKTDIRTNFNAGLQTSRFCYWSCDSRANGADIIETMVDSARRVGVAEDFHIFANRHVPGTITHPPGNLDVKYHIFKWKLLRDHLKTLNYDYFVWLDSDNFFTRHPGNLSNLIRGNAMWCQMESEITSPHVRRSDWWGAKLPDLIALFREFGVKSEKIWNTNGGMWIIRREAITEFCERAFAFHAECLKRGLHDTHDETPLALLGHLMVDDPSLNTPDATQEIIASDWTGVYEDRLPDGKVWRCEDYMTGESRMVNPAIVHAMRSKRAMERKTMSTVPEELQTKLNAVAKTGRFMVAMWSIVDGRINLDRTTSNFPDDDLEKSVRMLQADLNPHGVAVVIPCHNYGRFLDDCLNSVNAQTECPAEVVVVDDSSDDDTRAICERRGIKYLRVEFRNVYCTRRVGLEATASPFVVFLDADDMLAPTYLAECRAAIQADASLGIVTSAMMLFGTKNGPVYFPETDIEKMNWIHAGSLVRRAALEKSGAFRMPVPSIQMHADWLVWREVMRNGWKVGRIHSATYHYRHHEQSMKENRNQGNEKLPSVNYASELDRGYEWFTYPKFYEWLATQGKVLVEVGSWKGFSTVHLAAALKTRSDANQCRLYAVDTWNCPDGCGWVDFKSRFPANTEDHLYECFLAHLDRANVRDIVTPRRTTSVTAAAELHREGIRVDAVFIDAEHTTPAVLADIRAWSQVLKPGGIISGHDYNNELVRAAVDQLLPQIDHGDGHTWYTTITAERIEALSLPSS